MKNKVQQKVKNGERQSKWFRRRYYKNGAISGMIITKGELKELTFVELIPDK